MVNKAAITGGSVALIDRDRDAPSRDDRRQAVLIAAHVQHDGMPVQRVPTVKGRDHDRHAVRIVTVPCTDVCRSACSHATTTRVARAAAAASPSRVIALTASTPSRYGRVNR